MKLDFRGLEDRFSHNSYDIISSELFQDFFNDIAEETGMDPQDAFDQYLMCVTGEPVSDYTIEDVLKIQEQAVRSGIMSDSDIEVIHKIKELDI